MTGHSRPRTQLGEVARAARRTGRRLRANEMARRAAFLGLVPLVYAAAALVAVKLGWAQAGSRAMVLGGLGALAVPFAGVLHAALRKRPELEGALALDRHHGLSGRLANALVFSALPQAERTPMMEAAIEDALGLSRDLSPRQAAPLRTPEETRTLFVLALGVLVIALLEVRIPRSAPPGVPHLEALTLDADDVDLFRKASEEAASSARDPETAAGARRLNQLIEDIAARRLDRKEVFRRLDDIQRNLAVRTEHDAASADEALQGMAKELGKSALSRPLADALSEKRLPEAEQALRDLARKVAEAKKEVDKDKLDALRRSLQNAADVVQHQGSVAEKERREAEEQRRSLLQKKRDQGLSKSEQRELEKLERKLERLDREKDRREAQSKELSGLDRDLQKAAEDLMKELGQSSQDLNQGAEDLHRYANDRMSEEQKQELKRRIEELRQILRQEGQAGKERIRRMLSFSQRARGQQGQGQGQGQQGQGRQGQGQQGQGQQGQGQGQQGQLSLGRGAPGQGTDVMIMPGGATPGPGGGEKGPGGGGPGGGEEWGTGHDPNVAGDATRLAGHTEDVTAAAADTGEGASTSQVIHGASERGFSGRGYRKVFTEYQNVAEEALSHDEVPPGYRFYVKRYFQLIRPRD